MSTPRTKEKAATATVDRAMAEILMCERELDELEDQFERERKKARQVFETRKAVIQDRMDDANAAYDAAKLASNKSATKAKASLPEFFADHTDSSEDEDDFNDDEAGEDGN